LNNSDNRDIVIPRKTTLTVAHGSFIASLVPPPIIETNYILISPLLAPISSFTTFFTSWGDKGILSKRSAEEHSLSVQHILALYGTGDIFAFSTGRYRRYFDHVKEDWGDKIDIFEIEDGGHFWFDIRSRKKLLEIIKDFVQI
jgi:hypothetical protein